MKKVESLFQPTNTFKKLTDKFEEQKKEIQTVTRITLEVLNKLTIIPTKEVTRIYQFLLTMKGSLKAALKNHADCAIDA